MDETVSKYIETISKTLHQCHPTAEGILRRSPSDFRESPLGMTVLFIKLLFEIASCKKLKIDLNSKKKKWDEFYKEAQCLQDVSHHIRIDEP